MFEREEGILRSLLRELGTVFQRTGLPGTCTIPLPAQFHDLLTYPETLQPTPSERIDRLMPVARHIHRHNEDASPSAFQYYPLKPLSLKPEELLPRSEDDLEGYLREDYRNIWYGFIEEMQQLERQTQFQPYLFSLYFVLKKYFSRVPSTEFSEVSLFDVARISAAIQDCRYMYQNSQNSLINGFPSQSQEHREEDVPDVHNLLLIEGRISGIQKFLLQMECPQQEQTRHAHRLKGRSFYLLLLAETIADYLLAQLDLTVVHQIWCTGGHFLIMAPNIPAITYHLKSCSYDINTFMLSKFRGDLAILLESLPVSVTALHQQMGSIQKALEVRLERAKSCKLCTVLQEQEQWQFPTISSDDTPYDQFVEALNQEHEKLGQRLVRLNKDDGRLVKKIKNAADSWKEPPLVTFDIGTNLHIGWDINPSEYAQTDTIYLVNNLEENFWGGSSTKYGFKLLATHVDTYTASEAERANVRRASDLQGIPNERVDPNDMIGFADMARSGSGGFLGVLRMDVDHASTFLCAGFPETKQSLFHVAALSSKLDLFFTGYVNELCRTTSPKYTYLTYAGGDDLFLVGAWDELVNLACRIRQDFQTFTCNKLHISGGLFLCTGKYPIHRASEQAKYLLDDLAKDNIHRESDLHGNISDRNAFALFNYRLSWDDFVSLQETGEQLSLAITNGEIPRKSLYTLLNLHRTWKTHRQLNIARMFYSAARTIRNRGARKLVLNQHQHLAHSGYLPVLVGYTAVKTRHEA